MHRPTLAVAGADGAPGGWVVATQFGNRRPTIDFVDTLAPYVSRLKRGELAALGVDIPIGLPGDGDRSADRLARERLGPRRSTFFPTPVRAILQASTWEEASALGREAAGVGLSKQAWNLVPKIRHVDELWTPTVADTLVEVHPEVTFAEMAGGPVLTKKSDPQGMHDRCRLLARHLCLPGLANTWRDEFIDRLLDSVPRRIRVDAVDALAVLWSARRLAHQRAIRLGGELDPAGRPMALTI